MSNRKTSKSKRPYTLTMKVYAVMASDGSERLVRSYSRSDVMKHLMPNFNVQLATHDEIISMMAAGVPVETAGKKIFELPPEDAAGLNV